MREIAPGVFEGGTPAPVTTPAIEVSMGQAKLALLDAGKLDAVEAAIAAFPEPQKTRALIDWNYRAFVRRDHPTVALIGAAAGLSGAEIDALFAAAALIV